VTPNPQFLFKGSKLKRTTGGSIKHVGADVHIVNPQGTAIHKSTPNGTFNRKLASTNAASLQNGWVAYAYCTCSPLVFSSCASMASTRRPASPVVALRRVHRLCLVLELELTFFFRSHLVGMNTGSSPINYFDTTWTVPPAPPKSDGQTIFLFNSIEPQSGDAILQPVLQWGVSAAGGGAYWSIANWWGYKGVFHHTTLVQVPTGRVLQGIMTLTGQSGSTYNYMSWFNGIGQGLRVTGVPEQLRWATETLEMYSLKSKSDIPPGQTTFSNIHLRTVAGYPAVSWSTVSSTADGVTTSVKKQGSNGAAVRIVY